MKVFLIIVAVLAVLIIAVLSLSAEFTIIFENGWTTRIKVLFIEKDIKLSELLSFVLFPDKAGADAAKNVKEKAEKPEPEVTEVKEEPKKEEITVSENAVEPPKETEEIPEKAEGKVSAEETEMKQAPEPKPNYIQKILNEEGIVGILLLISNLIQTVNSAMSTLIKGLHIYSLYVKMIIGGGDAADIGEKFGAICGWYYPLKGVILNQMKVDNYDDLIQPDFIAPRSEYELQFIGSISIGLLVKVLFKAGKVFLVNFLKNK